MKNATVTTRADTQAVFDQIAEQISTVKHRPDGTYRIGITGLTAIAKPKCAVWNKAVNDALSVQDDEEFEDALYSLMKP